MSGGVRGHGTDHTMRFPRTLAKFGLTWHGGSRFSWFFIVLSLLFHGFYKFFHCFFKELDFKELEIHRYSVLDTINEFIDGHPSMNSLMDTINESIDGYLSMNMVPFLWAPSFGPLSLGPSLGPFLWAPWGPGRHGDHA